MKKFKFLGLTALLFCISYSSQPLVAGIAIDILDKGVRIGPDGVKVLDHDIYSGEIIEVSIDRGEDAFFESDSSICQGIGQRNLAVVTVEQEVLNEDSPDRREVRQILVEPYGVGRDKDGRAVLVAVQRELLYAVEVSDQNGEGEATTEMSQDGFEPGQMVYFPIEDLTSFHLVKESEFTVDPDLREEMQLQLEDVRCIAPKEEE